MFARIVATSLSAMALLAAGCSSPAPPTAQPANSAVPTLASAATGLPGSTVDPHLTASPASVNPVGQSASTGPLPGATAAPSPVAATSAQSHLESQNNGFGFDYPAGWRQAQGVTAEGNAGSEPIEQMVVGMPNGPVVAVFVYQLSMDVAQANRADLKSQLDQMLAQAVQQTGGKVLLNQPFKAGSVTGYEFRFQFDREGKTVESRQVHFFVGDRQYTVVMEMDPAGQSQNAQAFEQLIASFEAPVEGSGGERLARAVAATGHDKQYTPQNPGPFFPKGTRALEVVFQLSNAKAGGTLTGTWIADRVTTTWQPGQKIYEKSVNTEAGNFQGYFSVTSTKDFPPGDYALELRLDGKLLRRLSLHVAS